MKKTDLTITRGLYIIRYMKTMIKDKAEIKAYPADYFKEQGRLGGLKTLKKYGKKHYSKMRNKRKALDKGVV